MKYINTVGETLQKIDESLTSGSGLPVSLLALFILRGDALRFGIDVPVKIRRWLEALDSSEISKALAAFIHEMSDDLVIDVNLAVRQRDEAESVIHTVWSICMRPLPLA